MIFSTGMTPFNRKTPARSEENPLEEILLLEQLEVIANFPYSIEERFDLAFLHAAMQSPRAPHPEAIDIARVFDEDLHEYRVTKLNYLMKAFFANMNRGNPHPWSSLSAEAIGALDRRRLFYDDSYRAYITHEYLQMLRSGILDHLNK